MAKLKGQLFARLALDYFDHPKIMALSAEAIVAHLEMIVYSRKYGTDGAIPMRFAMRFASDVLDELASNDESAPSIIRNDDGSLEIYGYANMQETSDQIAERRQKRREAGVAGANARWQKDGTSHGTTHGKGYGKKMAETETETETDTTKGDSLIEPIDAWKPNMKHYEYGKEINVFVKDEAEKFKAHAIRNDRQLKNPNLAFTNWLKKLAPKGHPSTTSDAEAADRLRNPWKYT